MLIRPSFFGLPVVLILCVVAASYPLAIVGQTLNYRRDINNQGWPVPIFPRLQVTKETDITSSSNDITQSTHSFDPAKPYTKLNKHTFCEFGRLTSYAYKNKTFAIDGQCVVFMLAERDRGRKHFTVKEYMGAITRYTFYDEDGDGKFESRYNSSPGDPSFTILIPKWLDS